MTGKRAMTVILGLGAGAVLLAAAAALWPSAVEWWYLRELERAPAPRRLAAAKALAERRCVRAVPLLLRMPSDVAGDAEMVDSLVPRLLARIGPEAVPFLIATVGGCATQADDVSDVNELRRAGARAVYGLIGLGKGAVPALCDALMAGGQPAEKWAWLFVLNEIAASGVPLHSARLGAAIRGCLTDADEEVREMAESLQSRLHGGS